MCHEATSLAEAKRSSELRFHLAKFTWYLINIDDLGHKYPSSLESFQKRILQKEDPNGSILESFHDAMNGFYRFWDPIPANCMSQAAMDFINGCLLEQMSTIREMKLSRNALSWPYNLRRKTGASAVYAFAIFPTVLRIDLSIYIQVVDDIILFIDLVNDVLSFYKEYLSGEKHNYVYNRANVEQRSIPDTLRATLDDALAAHGRITRGLEDTEAYLPWKEFVNGYMAFHVTLKRYRLHDLNLGVLQEIPTNV
ncbi:Monoterpene synthase 25 [Psilocybe cubensis]|uniref:Monoterpene synthase 25 n=1 Tax=Psilocybe cubensis TaxID=181762 RepID=A0ACB8GQM9_PSICU|nr:Monoterpene synthase 25 [Psilocybe cubensis]KAH9477966.1 Monoterpene synthase 25 [Psilocybe cubensis]